MDGYLFLPSYSRIHSYVWYNRHWSIFRFNAKKYIWQIIFCVLAVIIGICCETSLASVMANVIDVGVNKFDLRTYYLSKFKFDALYDFDYFYNWKNNT